jgi:phage terminase large subunit-like protein
MSVDSSGNRKPDKARSRDKIDLAVASVLAVGIAAATPEPVAFDFQPLSSNFETP